MNYDCKRIAIDSTSVPMETSYRQEVVKSVHKQGLVLLIPEFCPDGQRLTCGPTLSTNQIRPWD